MKAQISRLSHQLEKQYSGIYQQQGRMITDADWNELVAIVKARHELASGVTLDSGVPRDGGVLEVSDTRSGPGIVSVDASMKWGKLVVDGIVAEVLPDDGAPVDFAYDSQLLFPQAPDLPATGNVTFYADVWERLVISIQDNNLRDPALHGADTCVRTQLMAQIKYTEDASHITDDVLNPQQGDALFDLIRAINTTDASDPCLAPTTLAKALGNYLFRLEVHSVDHDSSGNPTSVTLKWSSENGAEAHIVTDAPAEFEYGDWNYEFFDDITEQHLGVHLHDQPIKKSQLLTDTQYPAATPTDGGIAYPYVRRWDGYCVIQNDGNWSLVEGKHLGQDITADTATSMTGTGELSIRIGELDLTLKCGDKSFVTGDYWLALLRQEDGNGDQPQVLSANPVGIMHHYLKLVTVDSTQTTISDQLSPADVRQLSFPPLTNVTAERVGYSPTLTTESRWNDINETSNDLPYTVQDAIDQLASNIESSDIKYTFKDDCSKTAYDVKSLNTHLREDMGKTATGSTTKVEDLWDSLLCLLDANHIPYDPTLKEARWSDINEDAGTGTDWSHEMQLPGGPVANRLVRDNTGNIIATASSLSINADLTQEFYSIITKLSDTGDLLWKKELNAYVGGVGIQSDGTIIIAGSFRNELIFNGTNQGIFSNGKSDIYVAQLNSNGDLVDPPDTYGGSETEIVTYLAIDSNNSIYLTGYFEKEIDFGGNIVTAEADRDIFIGKLEADGTPLWANDYATSGTATPTQITVDQSDNIILTGSFAGELNFGGGAKNSTSPGTQNIFLAKLNGDGVHQWSYKFGSNSECGAAALGFDNAGNILLCGYYKDTINFGGSDLELSEGNAAYLVRFHDNGSTITEQWGKSFVSSSHSTAASMAVDTSNNIVLGGIFSGSIDFGDGLISAAEGSDAFIVRFDSTGGYLWGTGLSAGQNMEFTGSIILNDDGLPIFTWQQVDGPVHPGDMSSYRITKMLWEHRVSPATVQEALDNLVENLESSDISYRVPVCQGTVDSVRKRLSSLALLSDNTAIKIDTLLNALLCELDASSMPFDRNDNTGSLKEGFVIKSGDTMTGDMAIMAKLGVGVDRTGSAVPGGKLHISGGSTSQAFANSSAALEIDHSGDGNSVLQANGPTAPFRINLQDGHGRVSQTWNAYDSGGVHKYDANSEGAVWLRLHNGDFSLRTAPVGSAHTDISWNLGMYQATNGKVAIGKESPNSKLDVDGTVEMTGFKLTTGSLVNGHVLTYDSASGEGKWLLPSQEGWEVSGTDIYADVSGSQNVQVGIGTNAPESILHVKGNSPILRLQDSALNSAEGSKIRFTEATYQFLGAYMHYDGSANQFHIGVHNTSDSDIANDQPSITVNRSNGNVTISGDLTVLGAIVGQLTGTADNANALGGKAAAEYALAGHNHDGRYLRSIYNAPSNMLDYEPGEEKTLTTLEDRPDVVTFAYNEYIDNVLQGTTYVNGPLSRSIVVTVNKTGPLFGDKDYIIKVKNESAKKLRIGVEVFQA